MEDFEVVKFFQSSESVNDDFPDKVLLEILAFLLVLGYFVVEVSVVSELHHNA